jgi:hypothetical protein
MNDNYDGPEQCHHVFDNKHHTTLLRDAVYQDDIEL